MHANKHAQTDLIRLLRVAMNAKIRTDIAVGAGVSPWQADASTDMGREDKRELVTQLVRFVQCTHKVRSREREAVSGTLSVLMCCTTSAGDACMHAVTYKEQLSGLGFDVISPATKNYS